MRMLLRMGWLAACLGLLLALAGAPARQVSARAMASPGFYSGWVNFRARLDTEARWPALEGFVIEKFNSRGQLMVKVDHMGTGTATIVLPTNIYILDYGHMHAAGAECTFSSYALAQTNYVRLRSDPGFVDSAFRVPINLAPNIRFNKTHESSFGSLKGCDQAGSRNLDAMKKAMSVTTAEMREMEFSVDYHDADSMGGTCTIIGRMPLTRPGRPPRLTRTTLPVCRLNCTAWMVPRCG